MKGNIICWFGRQTTSFAECQNWVKTGTDVCQVWLGMRLSRLVVVTALIQISLDAAGIIISLLWPLATGIIAFDELKNDKWEYTFLELSFQRFSLADLLCTRIVPGFRERFGHIMITLEYRVLTLWSTCCLTSGLGSFPGWWTDTNASWRTRWSQITWTRGAASWGPASA